MDGINLKQVPQGQKNPRSIFDLSFKRAFDFKFGELVPVMMLPIVPDDEISVSYEFLQRMAPFLSQVFQDYKVCFDFYYVPNQLVYHNFELLMSSGYDGKTDYIHPYVNPGTIYEHDSSATFDAQHTIFDYLDIPLEFWSAGKSYLSAEPLNAIPFAAYLQCVLDHHLGSDTALNQVYQNILGREYILDDGDNTPLLTNLFGMLNYNDPTWQVPTAGYNPGVVFQLIKRLYPLDYFTSCRSNPQLGPVMTIPVELVSVDDGEHTFRFVNAASSTNENPLGASYTSGESTIKVGVLSNGHVLSNGVTINGSILRNTASINDFYSAARVQELLTLYNYSGFAPSERLAAEYGVENSDTRMHKAQWVHSSIHDLSIGEVFSNNVNNEPSSSTNMDIPGSGTAISTTNQSDRGFQSYFTQHGYLVGLMSVYPEASYYQGIPRHMSIRDRFDYPHYLLSEIGMASVKNKEILASVSNQSEWNGDFAYMSQYGDYKVGINRVNGNLRKNLNYMQAGRSFGTGYNPLYVPHFNDEFLKVSPNRNNLNRTFNVTSSYQHDCPLLSKISFNIRCKRQLPYYGLPRY